MPGSELRHKQRNPSPIAESPNSRPNDTVAEHGVGKQSRKKGKHAAPKESNTTKETDTTVAREASEDLASISEGVDDGPSGLPKAFPKRSAYVNSAVLGALKSADKVSDPDVSDRTDAWAQSTLLSNRQQTDLLEDTGISSSPPNAAITTTARGGFSTRTPPSSPPVRKSRPVSFSAGMPPPQTRHVSAGQYARYPSQSIGTSPPPPPHLPQPHFYGAPDIDMGFGSRLREAGSDAVRPFTSFAEIRTPSQRHNGTNMLAVLLGAEDRLDVVAVEKGKLKALGSLEGLGGTIVDAKILSWESGIDPFRQIRPLVSVVVHGTKREHSPKMAPPESLQDQDEDRLTAAAGRGSTKVIERTEYQTTVEIYSLSTQKYVVTLLCSHPTPGLPNVRGLPTSVPFPVGNFKLEAKGNFLTVSSGTSGEVFLFGINDNEAAQFRCIGKFWTSVQSLQERRYSNSSISTDPDSSPADLSRGANTPPKAIMSVSSRWLALVPPGPVSGQSLPVTIPSGLTSTLVPNLDSHNAPPRPPISCALESPDAESFINRVARGVAKEVVRGARWLGGQGLQTWNNYWNRTQQIGAQSPAYSRNAYQSDSRLTQGLFPPTHAPEQPSNLSEPQVVSIIDLYGLAGSSPGEAAGPIATFQPPSGVSFLSFSPDGLAIISVTRKGDVQYVWDLKQMHYLRATSLLNNANFEGTDPAAKVVQLAKFARMTPSTIVDIQWAYPAGDRFALMTKNGTIHTFDMPLAAFQWPPFRRSFRVESSSAPASPAVIAQPDEPTTAAGVFASAMKIAGKTQPMLANLRGRAPSIGPNIASAAGSNAIGFAQATGVRGRQAVAAGLSKSVGAATGTMHSLRHAGESRLHLVNLSRNPASSRVCWSLNQEQSVILVVDGHVVRSYRVSRRRSTSKSGREPVSVIDPKSSLNLPLPPSEQLSALAALAKSSGQQEISEGGESVHGYWTLPQPSTTTQTPRIAHPLSCAEIETNAPYQPFHSDRRVSLSVYKDHAAAQNALEPVLFGGDIGTSKLSIRPSNVDDEEAENNGASVLYRHTSTTPAEQAGGGEEAAEQIVVTTRRRRNKTPHASMVRAGTRLEDDDGFFEDDCDVLDFAEDRV
jgi:hypothetical protein